MSGDVKKRCAVSHPKHYNSRPDELECIDIVRHYVFNIGCAVKYLWRAGLKTEEGMAESEKEIEDLEKAVWYINDELYRGIDLDEFAGMERVSEPNLDILLLEMSGHTFDLIANSEYYGGNIASAMKSLLCVGLVKDGRVYRTKAAVLKLRQAIRDIQARIRELEHYK